MQIKDLTRISPFEWLIDEKLKPEMNAPVRIFASETLLEDAFKDNALEQAVNAAQLPGLVGSFCVMPDMHQGYGFPIGGVAASDYETGVISPGGIGYDINCGIRLLASRIPLDQAAPLIRDLAEAIFRECPAGVGGSGRIKLSKTDLKKICENGAKWALKMGLAEESDIVLTEDQGCISGADSASLSQRAVERALEQSGSLGAGNHFIEIDIVDQIFDPESAALMGLDEKCLAVQIHTGSRGFGHQICTDFVQQFQTVIHKYKIRIPDRELVCAPVKSPEGQSYLRAMRCAANYAFCNRQILAHYVRFALESVFKSMGNLAKLNMVYDLAHNIGKIETHRVGNEDLRVCVQRKGATRAFEPGHPDIPEKYRSLGQPVLIPGSMGTASWVLSGTQSAMQKSFGSCCHGAGRLLSRSQAKKHFRGDQLVQSMAQSGITVLAGSLSGLAEEAPAVYKDVDLVIEAAVGGGLAKKVARLRPVAVIKG